MLTTGYGARLSHSIHGVLLAAGDKSGTSEKRFYRRLIATADSRLDAHLERLKRKSEASTPKRKK